MGALVFAVFRLVMTVFVAHALTYVLVGMLPRTGIAVLGFGAAQENALRHLVATADAPKSYLDALVRLITMELGESLDGVAVSTLLIQSALTSLPALGIALGTTATVVVLTLAWPRLLAPTVVRGCFEFFTFLPAFVPAFVILVVTASLGITTLAVEGWQRSVIAGLSVSLMPTSLALIAIRDGFDHELSMPYACTLRAQGLSENRITENLRKAVIIQLISIADKIVTLQLAALIFTEVIFSMPGFGSSLLNAAQRTDINALIAFVIAISTIISASRLFGILVITFIDPRQEIIKEGG